MSTAAIDRTTARLAGGALALASALAIAGFTVLGSVFEYPQILEEPTSDILALFREHEGAVMTWFAVLVVSAAFGDLSTPLDEALATTLAWYRDAAAVPTH